MFVTNQRYLAYAIAILVMFSNSAFAKDTVFRRVQLAYGISLDVPSHWTRLSQDSRKNFRASSQAMMENAGVEVSGSRKETLLAMNAAPNPAAAMIRVNVKLPPDYTQKYLASVTPENLKEMTVETLSIFKKLEESGGPKVLEVFPIQIEKVNDYRVLIISYIRMGINGTSPWQVTQYKIPTSNKLIEITLSHRLSDAPVWRPILEKVKRSVRF